MNQNHGASLKIDQELNQLFQDVRALDAFDKSVFAAHLKALHAALDAQVRDRIIADTHGNPLALLELPRMRSVLVKGSRFMRMERVVAALAGEKAGAH